MTLVRLSNGGTLAAAPAASYERMSLEYGSPLPTNSTYRSTEAQQYLYDGWTNRLAGFNYALPPGQSVHEKGYALDRNIKADAYMRLRGFLHGWVRTNPSEPWHYEYRIAYDQFLLAPIGPTVPALKTLEMEDDMERIVIAIYRVMLKRQPSAAELDHWLTHYSKTGNVRTVHDAIYNSAEAKSKR